MQTFEQTFLKPGRYCVGRDAQGNKKFRNLTTADLREYVEGTKGVIAAGYAPPVLLDHAPPGTAEGAPVNRRDEKALEVRHGVGFLRDVKIGSDGAAHYVMDIADSAIAEKLRTGAIKFTSPELREVWTDGLGKTHEKLIAHSALVHKPRNPDQQPPALVEAALQFSLDDWEPIQMADEDDDDKPAEKAQESSNPDLANQPSENDQQFKAVLELLKTEFAIDLAADTSQETFVRDLMIGIKSAKAAREAEELEESTEDDDDENEDLTREDRGNVPSSMQFSLGDAEAGKVVDAPTSKCIVMTHDVTIGLGKQAVSGGHIMPATRKRLFEADGAVQFSADADYLPAFTLPQVLKILIETMPKGIHVDPTDATQFSTEEHPGGAKFLTGNDAEEGKKQGQEYRDKLIAQREAAARK